MSPKTFTREEGLALLDFGKKYPSIERDYNALASAGKEIEAQFMKYLATMGINVIGSDKTFEVIGLVFSIRLEFDLKKTFNNAYGAGGVFVVYHEKESTIEGDPKRLKVWEARFDKMGNRVDLDTVFDQVLFAAIIKYVSDYSDGVPLK